MKCQYYLLLWWPTDCGAVCFQLQMSAVFDVLLQTATGLEELPIILKLRNHWIIISVKPNDNTGGG